MKILVCMDLARANSAREDAAGARARLTEVEEYGIEQAVRLKEQMNRTPFVTVLGIGPEPGREKLRQALALGCDRAVQIVDERDEARSPRELAVAIERFCRISSYDVILTARRAPGTDDLLTPLLALLLGLRHATVEGALLARDGMLLERKAAGEAVSLVASRTPTVVSTLLGPASVRHPIAPSPVKAGSKEIITYPAATFCQEPPVKNRSSRLPSPAPGAPS